MQKTYLYEYDYNIIEILSKSKRLGKREIKKKLDYKVGKKVNNETFHYHITNLIKHKHIKYENKDNWKRGQKLVCRLTNKTIEEFKLGILHLDYKKELNLKTHLSKKDKMKQAYYIILSLIAHKQYISKNVGFNNAFLDIASLRSGYSTNSTEREEYIGMTINELTSRLSGVFAYWHIILNKKIVEEALINLKDERLIEEKEIQNQKYYVLSDSTFTDLIVDCSKLYLLIQFRLRINWQTIKPSKLDERAFFNMFYDKKDVTSAITHIQNILKQHKKNPNYKDILKQNKEIIDTLDYDINERLKKIKQKHSSLFEKHPALVDIILDCFCPPFLQKEVEHIPNKHKEKDKEGNSKSKTYPVVLESFSFDTVEVI